MKTIGWVGLLVGIFSVYGCSTTYSASDRAVVGTAIAVLIVGAAVHGGRGDEKRLQEDAAQPEK